MPVLGSRKISPRLICYGCGLPKVVLGLLLSATARFLAGPKAARPRKLARLTTQVISLYFEPRSDVLMEEEAFGTLSTNRVKLSGTMRRALICRFLVRNALSEEQACSAEQSPAMKCWGGAYREEADRPIPAPSEPRSLVGPPHLSSATLAKHPHFRSRYKSTQVDMPALRPCGFRRRRFTGSEFKRREWQTAGRRIRPPSELGNRLEIVFLDSERLIFESSVEGGMPSFAAAPSAPATLPLLSARADSMISFSGPCRIRGIFAGGASVAGC